MRIDIRGDVPENMQDEEEYLKVVMGFALSTLRTQYPNIEWDGEVED